MGHFLRAIKLSLRYKWTILASLVNALLIGALWGASITTVYPFVEVVLAGQTAESWLDGQIAKADESAGRLTREIAELRALLEQSPPEALAGLESQVSLKSARLAAEHKALERYQALGPWVRGHLPATPFATLLLVMALLILATLLKGLCLVLNAVLVSRVAGRTVMDMRRMFYRAALEMDQKTLDRHGTTSLMTLISHNVNLVGAGLQTFFGTSVREPLKMAACLVAAALISWRLLLLCLIVAPAGALLVHYLSRRMKRAAMQECEGVAGILHTLTETLNGIKLIRIFNREPHERCRFKKKSRSLYRLGMNIAFYDALVKPVTELTGIVTIVLAILVGAYLVLSQETHLLGICLTARPLSASALFVFYAMLAGAADPARKMGDIYNVLVRAAAASKGLYTLFDTRPEITAPARPAPLARHRKSIRFENVCFAYRPMHRVLDQVSFEIPFGQTVAIVGENGCGKTTLLGLLPRFYDPQQGRILLDGVDLRDLSPKRLRRQMSLVPQDPILFRGTVWENLVYGAPRAGREQALVAARLAHVEDFIAHLPNGYETQVGDRGGFLSGGQRQRLALARAILADRPILLLDEPTSQIDSGAEGLVQDSLAEFLRRRTTILVTHRLATIRLAQRVLVMRRGRIIKDLSTDEYFGCLRQLGKPDKKAA